MVKKTYKKKSATLTPFEKKFAKAHLKRSSIPEFKRVLRSRWWIGRMSK